LANLTSHTTPAEALAALEAGSLSPADFEAEVGSALRDGSLSHADAITILKGPLSSGALAGDTLSRLGLVSDPRPEESGTDVTDPADTLKTRARLPIPDPTFANPEEDETRFRPAGRADTTDRNAAHVGGSFDASPDPWVRHELDDSPGVGSVLGGRYLLERELGSGGMGVVFFARDQDVKGEVFAIKVLKSEVRAFEASMDLMREEVRKTRALSHPNIVGAYSINIDGPTAYILMEYLEGKTLTALIDEDFGRGMPFLRAWPLIQDIGAALAYAHDHSVIHCDLKPSNVFITTAGKAKLLDFGIAQAARGGTGHFDTASLGALTAAYASCEMLQERPPEQRDDVYSLGCVIYEMLSGKHPFDRPSALEAQRDKLRVRPIAGLTRAQNSALARALAFEREKRTPSVEVLLKGLSPNHSRMPLLAVAGIVPIAALGWWAWNTIKIVPPVTKSAVVAAPITSAAAPPVTVQAAPSENRDLPPALPVAPPAADPIQTQRAAETSSADSSACNEPPSRAASERAIAAGMKQYFIATNSSDPEPALRQLRASAACVTALRAANINTVNATKFLEMVQSALEAR
jgi:serine/threonine protein kinase